MSVKVGSAKYGSGGFKKRNYFKIKDGDNLYRVLPPVGENADEGVWSVFHKVHYGYKNSEGKIKPFLSCLVENRKSKMVEVRDPALDRINAGKAALEKAKAEKNAKQIELLQPLFGNGPKQVAQYNLDSNHYLNVVNAQGEIGILKLRHRAKMGLDAAIKRLVEDGVDPLAVQGGRWFNIHRSGSGLDTLFNVSVVQEKLQVEGVGQVSRDKVSDLSADILSRLESETANLKSLFPKPTPEQVNRMVQEGATAVDEILGARAPEESEESDQEDYQQPVSAPVSTQQAVQFAKAETETVSNVTTSTASKGSAALSAADEDFLKSLGRL